MDEVIRQLLASPDCDLHLRPDFVILPEFLPADLCSFFGRCFGGRLFYDRKYPTPQFGCHLGLSEEPVSRSLGFDNEGGYCEGEEFDSLYAIAFYEDTGDYTVAAVSTLPDRFGHIYTLSYGLGDPTLQWSDVAYAAPSFSRWLSIHMEAWEIYQSDWREGLRHFGALMTAERRAAGLTAGER